MLSCHHPDSWASSWHHPDQEPLHRAKVVEMTKMSKIFIKFPHHPARQDDCSKSSWCSCTCLTVADFEQAASATRSVQQAKSVTNCVGNWLNYDSEKSYDWEAARFGLQDIRTKLSTWDVCPEQYYIRGQGDVMRKSLSKIPEWARFAFVPVP